MSAWTRIGWGVVALAWVDGAGAGAGSISGGGQVGGGMSSANLTTNLPSWKFSSLSKAPSDTSSAPSPPPDPGPPPQIQPPPDAYSYTAPGPVVTAPAPAPAPVSAPLFVSTPAAPPAPLFTPAAPPAPLITPAAAVAQAPGANAFVNLGHGPYPEADQITNGNPQPWSNSPQIVGLFGGPPDARQQADFTATVMQRVQQTFQNSGVAVSLTSDPSVPAAHTLSLVSQTTPRIYPGAIGLTDIGANGFSFIDQEAKSAQSVDQLEWIVAHNISHELMLAFGVSEKYDTSGAFIDARNAKLSMMLDPTAAFSSGAAAALNQSLAPDASTGLAPQVLEPQLVAEPATLAVWGLGVLAAALRWRAAGRRREVA